MDNKKLLALLKKVVEMAGPDLRAKMALPRKAKIMAVKPAGGTYVCDVQAVLNDGSPDPKAPLIPEVEIPSLWSGPDRGLVCPPTVGEFCDLVFYDGDPNCPAITNFRPAKDAAPEAELDSLMIQHSPGIRLGFKPDGTVIIEAPKIEATATEHIKAKAGTLVEIECPLIRLIGRVEIQGGLYQTGGAGGRGAEIDGPVKIINGGLTSQGSLKTDGNVNAAGDIMAAGKSDNHHGH